ncbi:MAG: hypothetical protein HY849_10345 [Nitrosomonadales bacterium]|nr:hypothetical protein [Nitrosomonadales bacterium]
MRLSLTLILISVLLPASAAADDLVVVVNPKTGVNKLSREEVIDIFLGRNRQLPSGMTALPLDQPNSLPGKAQFYSQLTGKEMAEINAYWARLMFSGRASPPTQVRSQEEVVLMVIENRSAIGYVERSKAGPQVKIVFDLAQK